MLAIKVFFSVLLTYLMRIYCLLSTNVNRVVEAFLLKCLNLILVVKTSKPYFRKYVLGKCGVQGQRQLPVLF